MKTNYEYNKEWRKRNPDKRGVDRKRYYAQFQGAPNTRKPWTEAENLRVLAHDIPDRELAKELGRSVQAIQVHRGRIK